MDLSEPLRALLNNQCRDSHPSGGLPAAYPNTSSGVLNLMPTFLAKSLHAIERL